ncbi:tetratricopeptide repeat protein [Sphingobium yanoikuyae]|uniref:tetratricopeptide repeat protein n=1 Tax=Sphingobium yanoikuyae TaxID=13690 RepID=UPI00391846BB
MRFAFLLPVIISTFAAPIMAQAPSGPATAQPAYHEGLRPSWDNLYNIDSGVYGDFRTANYGRVRQLMQQGHYAQADKALNRIMSGSNDLEARFLKGVTTLALNNPEGARRYFERALPNGRSGHPGAMSGLALAEIRLGNPDAARDLLRKLEYQKEKCAGNCDRATSIDQAIGVVKKALS